MNRQKRAPPPGPYCTDCGSKEHHQFKMAVLFIKYGRDGFASFLYMKRIADTDCFSNEGLNI